ncbi:hypothetical protein N325_04074 [Colius striatus]|nr:hypothetical protein N325_04074 [Colius striatus]
MWYHKPVVHEELLQSLPNLKTVASSGVGIDHLDLKLLASHGVKVSNTPFAVSTDTGMALMLASSRRLVEGFHSSTSARHILASFTQPDIQPSSSSAHSHLFTLLVHQGLAFQGFIARDEEQVNKEEESAVGAVYCKKLDDLLQPADFVLLSVTLTPQTHKLIGKRQLELMKPTATLINISRGLVVDQDALVEALQNKVIKAAALDVTYPEPVPR